MRPRTMLTSLLLLALAAAAAQARTKLVALPQRNATIIRLDNPNATLIEEERVLTLQKGLNKVDFSWKAVSIDADSIRLTVLDHPEQVKLLGAQPVIIQPASGRLKITAEELQKAITPKTKLFILNSPSNPSGEVYGKEELLALADVILDAGITVLSDEIYEKIRYDGAIHYAIAGIKDGMMARTITVNGVSKAYAMTGWRIGYAAGPKEIMAAVGKIQSQQTSNPCSIAQAAALAALTGPQESTAEMVKAFEERRSVIVERLNRIEGVSCPTPAGAFYVFPNVSVLYGSSYGDRRIGGSVDLCTFLLEEMHVACVPGSAFGMDAHIRLSYATSMENIRKALDRIEKGIGKLAK